MMKRSHGMPTLGVESDRLTKVERTVGHMLYLTGSEASTESFRVGKEVFVFSCGRSSSSGLEDECIHLPPSW